MNYITTDKHPYIKGGLKFVKREDGNDYENELYVLVGYYSNRIKVHQIVIDKWLSEGSIIEGKNMEFTKQDMIDFADFHSSYRLTAPHSLKMFLDRRKPSPK